MKSQSGDNSTLYSDYRGRMSRWKLHGLRCLAVALFVYLMAMPEFGVKGAIGPMLLFMTSGICLLPRRS